jgi:hypothetical protein
MEAAESSGRNGDTAYKKHYPAVDGACDSVRAPAM